jgi:cyclic pyranopterin phosphate synthase
MALDRPLYVRFIECMPMTGAQPDSGATAEVLLDSMAQRWDLAPAVPPPGNGPARYFQLNAGAGAIGVVTPMSAPFCGTCNRLRLTSQGCLRPCLFSDRAVDLRPALRGPISESELQISRAFELAVLAKPQAHDPCSDANLLTMAEIGG